MISFSDNELKTISKVILETPQELAQTLANKDNALLGKEDALKKDQANEIFFDNVLGIVDQYQKELRALNGSNRTLYLSSDLNNGGKLAPDNPHFPLDWVLFQPKITQSMNGLPITNESSHEIFRLGELNSKIDTIKNGWVDGSTSATLSSAYNGESTLSISSGSFSVGDLIVIFGSSNSALAIVTEITNVPASPGPPPVPSSITLNLQVIAPPNASIPIGGTVRNYFSGFTNTQRESWVVTPYNEVFSYLRSKIIEEKDFVKNFLNNQISALNLNEAVGAEATANNTAKTNAQNAVNTITTWENLPNTGSGSKFGNSGILNLENVITNRSSQAPARANEITSYLGSSSQATNGSYSGSGQYLALATWIDLRINKSVGTLRVFYDFDQIIAFIDQSIAVVQKRKNEYDQYMIVKRIVSNPNNTAIIGLEDVTGLVVSNSIKIIDDSALPSLNANILGITGNIVTLSVIVPSTYTIAQNVRLIKML
jgi:hypothetical protein